MFGLFSPKSSSTSKTELSERITNVVSGEAPAYANTLGGITLSADGKNASVNPNINVQMTDFGAVSAGADVAKFSVDSMAALSGDVLEFSDRQVDTVSRALQRGQEEALDFASASQEEAFGFAYDTNKKAFDFSGAALSLVGDAISGIRGLAADTIASADSALTRAFASTPGGEVDASRDVVKYVALAAVAGLVIMVFARK